MMKQSLLCVFVLLSGLSFAAKKLPGYIVLRHGGDTLRNEVKGSKYKDWREFQFVYPDGEKVVFKPSQVLAVHYGDQHFVSIPVDSLNGLKELVHDGFVLLEQLVDGPLSLYELNYCEGKESFKGRKNGISKQQCYSKKYLSKGGKQFFEAYRKSTALTLKNYQVHSTAQLAGYLKESKVLSDDILYEKISRTSLELICRRYNVWYATTQ